MIFRPVHALSVFLVFCFLPEGKAQDLSMLDSLQRRPFSPEGRIKGTGVVTLRSGDLPDTTVVIYDRHLKPKFFIDFTRDSVNVRVAGELFHRHHDTNPLAPRLFIKDPKHPLLTFDCIRKLHSSYDVVVNEKTRELGFIKIGDPAFRFQTHLQYVNERLGKGFEFDRIRNPLRQGPFDNAIPIENALTKTYRIWPARTLEVRGEWVKVSLPTHEVGWVRWTRAYVVWVQLHFTAADQ